MGLALGEPTKAGQLFRELNPQDSLKQGTSQVSVGCNNTDITSDANGGNDYAYYSIIDPDKIADNGDEMLAFALRISDRISGAFTFSFLIDADDNCGSDPDATCGNPCFEYEVQLNTQTREINVILIDGCSGVGDCDAMNGPLTTNGTDAFICKDCTGTDDALQVCAGSSECVGTTPVFWVFYVNFSDLPTLTSTSTFRIVPATTTSPNSVIYKNTNVSDYGGIGNPNDITACDCETVCAGSSCADCARDCALSCASGPNNVSFPVELVEFEGKRVNNQTVELSWITASELNNSHFEIERSVDGLAFIKAGSLPGAGTTQEPQSYSFFDKNSIAGTTFYRLRQVDHNGSFAYSHTIQVDFDYSLLFANIQKNPVKEMLDLSLQNVPATGLNIQVRTLTGQALIEKNVNSPEQNFSLQIPVGFLNTGLYFLSIQDHKSGRIQAHKFLKL